ncbi:DUF4376 domain-containing protein (plasmid) [Pseudomonas atacamensis]|nr:DUF4376 domain-containing protein [Pseudomonas atacamensis]
MYPPVFTWALVPPDVTPALGWKAAVVDGDWQFSPPDLPVVMPEPLAEVVAAERFSREGTGVTVEGLAIETTRDSQALIASTGLSAVLDPEYRCNFKTATGFVEIGAEQIIVIAKAVRAHVQACFDREKALLEMIAAGTYRNEMLAEGWPDSNTTTVEGGAE